MAPKPCPASPEPISRKRYRLGFWSAPVLTWSFYVLRWMLEWVMESLHLFPVSRVAAVDLAWFSLFTTVIFLLATAWVAGLAAAYFWRIDLPLEAEKRAVLNSVWLAWAPTVLLFCAWCVLWIPFLFYLWTYRVALDYGKTFWLSPRARQWIGDFSTHDEDI